MSVTEVDNFSALTISIAHITTANKDRTPSAPAISTTTVSHPPPVTGTSSFFELPSELRDMVYTSLLSLETSPDSTTTDINQVRGTVPIMPPPERIVSRRFEKELGHVHELAMTCSNTYSLNSVSDIDPSSFHRQFPKIINLQLEIENPLDWIYVHEKVQWADRDQYPRFTTIPQVYKEEMEVLVLECFLAPNLHLLPGNGTGKEMKVGLDEWILSLVDWIRGLLDGAERLERVELRLLVDGDVEDLEEHLDVFLDLPCVQRVELAYECRLGSRILSECAEGWPFLRWVEAVWVEECGWVFDRVVY